MKTNAALFLTALSAACLSGAAFADDKVKARLTGYQEVPAVSSVASGSFEARIHRDGEAFDWELEYEGLQGTVQQAHIHFAQKAVTGAIVVWLCGTGAPGTQFAGPAGTQTCPQSGRITGTAMAGDVGPGSPTQQLTAGEIAEVISAMRAGVAYANVHTNLSPGGEIRGQVNGHGRGHHH
jgi:hypothetical protein